MRDPDLLVELLRKMNDADDGSLVEPQVWGADQNRRHHLDLLDDAGQARWNDNKSIIRITNDGYDFLNAIEKSPGARKKFLELFEKGIRYVTVVQKVIEVVDKLAK